MEECDEDEDVVLEGSALHQHLVSSGYETELEIFHKNDTVDTLSQTTVENIDNELSTGSDNHPGDSLAALSIERVLRLDWTTLAVQVAHQAIKSELLVDEDVDFLKKFLQLDDNNGASTCRMLPLSVSGVVTSLALIVSSSTACRWLSLSCATFTFGVSYLQARKYFLQTRIINTYRNLLLSSARLKSLLNQVELDRHFQEVILHPAVC